MSDIFSRKELKKLLLKAKAADRELAQELVQFGASKHKYQWNPPAVLSDVEAEQGFLAWYTRWLHEMPNLKKVNLQQCQLEHNDILDNMHLKTF